MWASWVRTSWHAFDAFLEGLRGAYRGFWIWMRIRWDECHQPEEDVSIDALLQAYRQEWIKLEQDLPKCPATSNATAEAPVDSDPSWVPTDEDVETESVTVTLVDSDSDDALSPRSD